MNGTFCADAGYVRLNLEKTEYEHPPRQICMCVPFATRSSRGAGVFNATDGKGRIERTSDIKCNGEKFYCTGYDRRLESCPPPRRPRRSIVYVCSRRGRHGTDRAGLFDHLLGAVSRKHPILYSPLGSEILSEDPARSNPSPQTSKLEGIHTFGGPLFLRI